MHLMFAPHDRVLGAALGLSLALHAAALAVHFKFPQAPRASENLPLSMAACQPCNRLRPTTIDSEHKIVSGRFVALSRLLLRSFLR